VSQCVGLEVVVLVVTARPIKKTDSIGHLHCLKVERLKSDTSLIVVYFSSP